MTYYNTLTEVSRQTSARDFSQFAYRPTSTLAQTYLSPSNTQMVANEIAKKLYCLTGVQFNVPVNNELILAMQQVLEDNVGMWTSAPQQGLQELNRHIIESETQIQVMSWRNHMLYDKYFITQNRQRVEDRPVIDTLTKGEQTLDTSSAYMNVSPWGRQHPEFLKMFALQPRWEGDWNAKNMTMKFDGCTQEQADARYS